MSSSPCTDGVVWRDRKSEADDSGLKVGEYWLTLSWSRYLSICRERVLGDLGRQSNTAQQAETLVIVERGGTRGCLSYFVGSCWRLVGSAGWMYCVRRSSRAAGWGEREFGG